jgi:transposase
MAGWIEAVLAKRCPESQALWDPFQCGATRHRSARQGPPRSLKRGAPPGGRATWRRAQGHPLRSRKNPENLTARQQSKLADVEKLNRPLHRAYLLKEQLRQIYWLGPRAAIRLLDEWLAWARRCRLKPFVKLARTIAAQREGIVAAIRYGLSNARVEAINTQIR